MSLFDYLEKYGDKSFEEVSFNEVDNILLASLSYVNFYGIITSNSLKKITLKEAGDKYFEFYPSKQKYILSVRQAVKILKTMKDTKRYGGLYLYNYIYKSGSEQQFSAVTIEINPKLVYVSFEGTDHLVCGWKEDFMMTYKFPVESQKRAIEYVNKYFFFTNKQIILGGHSKGGNLAMVAGMYTHFWIKNKIINIYNNDGPGLLKEIFNSKQYNSIAERLITIIPNYSIVGILLYHSYHYIVVKSSKKGPLAHDLYNWMVEDNSFVRAELDTYSEVLDVELKLWLDKYSKEERKRFVFAMFKVFELANVNSLIELMDDKRLFLELINNVKELESVDVLMLKDFASTVFNCFKNVKIEEFKSLFDRGE